MIRRIEDIEPGNDLENEQSPEDIARVLIEAIETQRDLLLTQIVADGGEINNIATPIAIEGRFLVIEVPEGSFSIELPTIKKARIVDVPEK